MWGPAAALRSGRLGIFMRQLCNLLIGLPLLGFCGGSILFLIQSIRGFSEGPQPWQACLHVLSRLFYKWSILDATARLVSFYCDLCLGAHIALWSLIVGAATIPLGLLLARRIK